MENRPSLKPGTDSDKDEGSSQQPVTRVEDGPCFPEVKEDEIHVCVWGTPSAGKTTYMGMLWDACQNPDKKTNPWIMNSLPETLQWSENQRSILFSQFRFPDATPLQRPRQLKFDMLSADKENYRDFQLTFIEAPGEMYKNPENYAETYGCRETPIDYLRRCSGIVMLIDPDVTNDFNALVKTLEVLSFNPNTGRAGPITIPIAFCLTKCDEVNLRYLFDAEDQSIATENHVREKFPRAVINMTSNPQRIRHSKWYPISAIGYEDGKLPITHIRYDGTYGLKTYPRARNILEPLRWVIEQLDY